MELIVEAIVRLRSTDPADTAAALLAAWHGFATAQAAGSMLAQDSPDDAVLARNARPIMAAVAAQLREAPSLPYTDVVTENVSGLVPHNVELPADDHPVVDGDPDQPVDDSPAGIVRRSILMLALELNTLLPQAAEHAREHADRRACEHGTRLAYELGRCWEGGLRSLLNNSHGLSTAGSSGQRARGRRRNQRNTRRA